jgi:hypothetical protein
MLVMGGAVVLYDLYLLQRAVTTAWGDKDVTILLT